MYIFLFSETFFTQTIGVMKIIKRGARRSGVRRCI